MKKKLIGAILGFDPGGSKKKKNGVACLVLRRNGSKELKLGHCASVDEATCWFRASAEGLPLLGIGIDTLLAWSGAEGGSREADRALRKRFPKNARSVISANGLYGSMCLSGPLLAARLQPKGKAVPCFETHPKILIRELSSKSYNWRSNKKIMLKWASTLLGIRNLPMITSDDELDAALSVGSAYKALSEKWKFDLYSLSDEIGEALLLTVPRASYPWPKSFKAVPRPARASLRSRARGRTPGRTKKAM